VKARTLLRKLTDYGLTVQAINDETIRLSPPELVNDKVLTFIRTHKNDLLCALHDEQKTIHHRRKAALREGRVEILRITLRHYLKPGNPSNNVVSKHELEEYLDCVLKQFDYAIEDAIQTYKNIIVKPVMTCKCGYNPPFCSCGGISLSAVVACNQCEHFIPDNIGDGGIGKCDLDIEWTSELKGRMPYIPIQIGIARNSAS
jgi:hypothetical protein